MQCRLQCGLEFSKALHDNKLSCSVGSSLYLQYGEGEKHLSHLTEIEAQGAATQNHLTAAKSLDDEPLVGRIDAVDLQESNILHRRVAIGTVVDKYLVHQQ